MRCKYFVFLLAFFIGGKANAQVSPYTFAYNFDGYYNVMTWGPWQHTLYERYYTDKLFYIPSNGSTGPSFYFKDQTNAGAGGIDYDKNSCSAGSKDWHFNIYYTVGGNSPYYSYIFTPSTGTLGTTNVGMSTYSWDEGHCSDHGYGPENTTQFASFNVTVEQPQWNSTASVFNNICQDVNTSFNLADYFSVPGAVFNIDYAGDTTWQFPGFPNYSHDYQYDNGMYTLEYPLIWVDVYDPQNPQVTGYWTPDYGATPDTTWNYPGFPDYTQDYQRANKLFTNNPTLITQINPHDLSPGVHTLLAIKNYDNGVSDASYGSHRGPVQFPFTITILPGAPVVQQFSYTASCPDAPSGTISVSGVSGGDGNYRYILRNGLNNTDPCDPSTSGSCFNIAASGSFAGSAYTITGMPAGDYTLWIANNGGTTGACAKTYNISIQQLSYMDTLPMAIQNISCPGGNNGFINVTDTGGLAPYTFSLTNGGNTATNATGQFASLSAGSYVMNTKDGCQHAVQRTIVLTEPLPVTVNAVASATDCNYPANGTIDISASGGSGMFDYYLYDNAGNPVSQQLSSVAATWSVPALPAGNYTAAVNNSATPGCAASSQPVVVIGPPALTIGYIGQTDNKCSYDAAGSLQLSGGGGQLNGYIFFLQNTSTQQVLQSASGSFSNLPAAVYKAWVRNRDLSCLDSAIYASPVVIAAPPVLQAAATATDVTCNGMGDGTLQASVGGGTPGYQLQWQLWDNQAANWLPMNGLTGLSAAHQLQGSYRLLVTDQNNCSAYSDTVVIAEPISLQITTVNRTDIVCYGGTGSLQMSVLGGNGNYIYEASADNGNSWNAFTGATAFAAGSYQLKVSDSKGCTAVYGSNVDITAPAAALSLSYTLTDYNGYNVPCYGGNNGVVQLNAAGGNGSTYAGYTYAVDNGSFGTSPVVTTFAGFHNLSVKDARGCLVTTSATLSQPPAHMQSAVSGKQDNDCAGGHTGQVTITAAGGTPQYTFSITGTDYQSSPVFTGLVSGAYRLITHDVNGCSDSIAVSIIDLNPPVSDLATINHVLCFDGHDGRITLSTSGGAAPYNYAWRNNTATGNTITGLAKGTYYVTISDSKGCSVADSFVVAQPLVALTATLYARPVCVNNPYGNIMFDAQGGTAPYTYSINGGAGFSNAALFSNVVAGTYPVKVADANGCSWTGSATVAVNAMNPQLNFLVSTRQNAMDTLQVKEVCVPVPDSIQWMFDPQTVVLGNDMHAPLIRYNQPGSYPVSMRAWFGGCDFVQSKIITINPYDAGVVNNYNNYFGIDTVIASPNPSNGNFTLQVKLFKKQRLYVKIYSAAGVVLWNKQWEYANLVQESVSLPANLGNGLVFVKVLTEDDARDLEVLIAK